MPTPLEGFLPPDQARERARREDALADAAARDGDGYYESLHRREAAAYREIARKGEITDA